VTATMRQPRPFWIVVRLIIGLAALIATSYGVDWVLRTENFPVRNVRFEGPFERVTQAELDAAVLSLVRGNFFLVDLDAVRERVEALAWVHRAEVRRRFPQDIAIQFTEEQLAARWSNGAWVNTSGEVVRVTGTDLPTDLPQLVGPDGTSAQVLNAYRDFRDVLANVGLSVATLTLTPRRSWQLDVAGQADDQRLTLVLDHEQPRVHLERFVRVYRASLASQLTAIQQVDLRYTNGFAVQWRRGIGSAHIAHHMTSGSEG
jgi:cell division protein FtsQ